MKIRIAIIISGFLCFFEAGFAHNRVACFGSNPDFSFSLFPQDVSRQHSNAFIIYPGYCKAPWWGDIDEITNKPSGAVYTITGTEISKSAAYFKESAKLHTLGNAFGYSHRQSEKFTLRIDFDYTLDALRDRAEGNLTNSLNTEEISYIPFDYSLRHTLNSFRVSAIAGFPLFDIPFGVKVGAGVKNTLALKSDFNFTKNDTLKVSTSRALWGWSTQGCSHIFGVSGTEGDAWLQSSYSKGPIYTIELTSGASLDRIKAGISFLYNFGRQDHYSWRSDTSKSKLTGDTVIDRNFIGDYERSDWTKKSHLGQINVYGNIHWLKAEMFSLNSFVRVGYTGDVAGNALASNLEIESDSKETRRGFMLEADPNITIELGPWLHYIDIALLMQYEYYRRNNTYLRWFNGGRTKTYWNTGIRELEETAWETFSYANQNIFNTGLELSAMFPLFNNNLGKMGLGLMMSGNVQCNFQTKYYGRNDSASIEFNVNGRRENYTREVSFGTVLMLQYMRNRYSIRLETASPLLHSQMVRTRLADAKGKNAGPYHRKDPLWLSNQGLKVGAFITYDIQRL
jgi:hypothetical protein